MNSGGQSNRPKKTRSSAMPSTNNNSRYRGKEPRSSQGRPPLEASGVYADPKYAHALSSVIGCTVQVLTTAHQRFEGVLVSVSSENDAALGMVNLVDEADPKRIDPKEVKDKLIFKTDKIVTMTVRNVDLDYAAKSGFQTDSAIQSKTNGAPAAPKELQPWVADVAPSEKLVTLGSANGWDPHDMFTLNERKYGVRSTYDQSLQGYTTQLEQTSHDQEAHAKRIADEIERSSTSRHRADMENGDEETTFAAVVRPGGDRGDRGERGDRYVPPARRQPSREPPAGPRQSGPRGPPPSGRPPRGGGGPQGGGMGGRGPSQHHGRGGGGRQPHPRASPPAHLQPPQHHGRVNGDGGERGSPPTPAAPSPSPPARGASKSPAVESDRPRVRSPEERAQTAETPRRGPEPRGNGDVRNDARPASGDVRNGDVRHGSEPRPSGDVRVSGGGEGRPGRDDVRVSGGDTRSSRASGDVRASDDVRQQQRQQNGKAERQNIESLKTFNKTFMLSEEPARREEAAAPAGSQRTTPPAGPGGAQGQKQETPAASPAQTPEAKPAEGDKSAGGSKSKLNPNAKAFTPSQPSSLPQTAFSPSPTPPRVVTPMAAVQPGGPYSPLLPAGYPSPVLGGYLPMAGGQQFGVAPQPQPPPRMARHKGGGEYAPMGGMPHRPDAATPMQVAAVTGQPLMAPSPMGGHPAGPHLPMALPQPGLMQPGPGGYPQMVVRMVHPPMYGAPAPQQGYEPSGQQGGPPPGPGPHQLAYGMVPQPGPGPAQPPTPGPQPGGAGPGLMYPVAGAAGGPGGPANMYLVSAGQQMHPAHFALMQQQAGGQLSNGPMTSSVTSAVMSLGQQPYYIPAQQHPGQPYGPASGVPMPLVPSHQ
ncbi:basic proline-rich protein-like isoform X1 [Amphibalanus amphitrite]|uniref:basic proline-rich protein-like isoform X1 n=1 Tax=Amphibalanus amphitrite TaxID=1232801 RepID=UPI001C915CD7|nr:basic proline-rich protein-like isoform X1 [Amphibalanus amphitrite]